MIRGMGMKIHDAFQGNFRKKKPTAEDAKPKEVESLTSSVRITYLSRRQLEEASLAEKYLLENLDHGADFKNLYFLKHQFLIIELEQPVFCDLCGLLIWGIYRLSLKCRNCNLSCHPQCKQFLRLICPKPRPEKSLPSITSASDPVEPDDLTHPADRSVTAQSQNEYHLHPKIVDEFNKVFPFSLLQLDSEGSYSAFVKILLRLRRPVTVANGPYPKARVTSFYLPRNSEKLIHITSYETTPEVIVDIISKFHIRDDPRKFSLYLEEKNGVNRLETAVRPLQLVLSKIRSGADASDCCRLILQETDPKNVLWDAFTEPELENFKLILDREEEEFIKLIMQNYDMYKQRLMEALDLHKDKL